MKTFKDIKWINVILADTPDAEFYPFYKHYTEPFKVETHNRGAITVINHWMESDVHKGKGLLVIGPDLREINHLLFLAAQHLGFAVHQAADISDELFTTGNDYQAKRAALQHYKDRNYAISFFGEEQGKEYYINDIIRSRWKQGKGVILATTLSSEELKAKYGNSTEVMLSSSCTKALIFKE